MEKMSKSKKNVIDPNILLDKYGADTTRFFCLFAAPPELDLEWSEQGVEGGFRFLNRVWRLAATVMDGIKDVQPFDGNSDNLENTLRELYRKTHQTIQRVTRDVENRLHFNTAISAVMELFNTMSALDMQKGHGDQLAVMRFAMESLTLLLSPIVPHFAEELYEALGHRSSVLLAPWPQYREDALEEDELLIVVQVNGKLRSRFQVATGTDEETIKERAL
ncbi:MAG: class I tRNA ligase family protein, partial [bacterium]|nr:class I tRNA ligase family protein [bacterium]